MLRNPVRLDPSEVFLVHPVDEVLQDVGRDILAEGCHGLENLFPIGGIHWAASISQDCSLCASDAASIMPRHTWQNVEKGRRSLWGTSCVLRMSFVGLPRGPYLPSRVRCISRHHPRNRS